MLCAFQFVLGRALCARQVSFRELGLGEGGRFPGLCKGDVADDLLEELGSLEAHNVQEPAVQLDPIVDCSALLEELGSLEAHNEQNPAFLQTSEGPGGR